MSATAHGPEGVADFYRVLAANLRDLGSPVHRREFFRNVMDTFGEDACIVLVRYDGRTVGSGLVLFHGDRAVMPWSGSLRSFFRIAPSQLLYWHAICQGFARGCRVIDCGRSSPGSGTYGWKREWAAEPVQLYWHRLPGDQPDGDVQRWQWGIGLWRHLPVLVASTIGAAVRGGLPQ